MEESVFRSWKAKSMTREVLHESANDPNSIEDAVKVKGSSTWQEEQCLEADVLDSSQLADVIARWIRSQIERIGIDIDLDQLEQDVRFIAGEALVNVHRYGFKPDGCIDLHKIRVIADVLKKSNEDVKITLSFIDQGFPLPKQTEVDPRLSHGRGRMLITQTKHFEEEDHALEGTETKVVSYTRTIPAKVAS